MSERVLDASVVLALLFKESGGDPRYVLDGQAAISTVNFAEVASRLALAGADRAQISGMLTALGLEVVDFDEQLALDSGLLRPFTQNLGLSLADRACLALARRLQLPALTADRAWQSLRVGVDIQVTR